MVNNKSRINNILVEDYEASKFYDELTFKFGEEELAKFFCNAPYEDIVLLIVEEWERNKE